MVTLERRPRRFSKKLSSVRRSPQTEFTAETQRSRRMNSFNF